jgi:hypothetical protein
VVSLNYSLSPKKYLFSPEADGIFQTDGFTGTSYVDSLHITRGGVANGPDSKTFNLTFFARMPIVKWWELSMNHTYVYNYYAFKAGINTGPIAGSSYNLWLDTDFKFWKNAVIQVGGWFNSRSVNQQGLQAPIGGLHASIKKSFLKDRLTASIAAQNILQSIKWQWTLNTGNLYTAGSWQEFDRMLMFTLAWHFGSGNSPLHKEKDNNDRLGGGGGGRG